ncbi:hypothetical protein SAMD00019534_069580 [Acytostelium subglobosum LB1]|uniref:hypothetical protein n=1 Tax=Acytostelium subglobosum LB1 TaxID=1410327 RepID=UPI00064497CE|nr:hypothetical protein SAMD00019534_069580 [Acytostelium subglobosum LB1]GAM23783.1 hypothetical protein SAMD00019534_069580 [Acytostelium subglobosum LB1]|eukprot:XP_012753524.1 hypothetical protein SAMD00019534_069580 [Acytostelium subglobosum LB1]
MEQVEEQIIYAAELDAELEQPKIIEHEFNEDEVFQQHQQQPADAPQIENELKEQVEVDEEEEEEEEEEDEQPEVQQQQQSDKVDIVKEIEDVIVEEHVQDIVVDECHSKKRALDVVEEAEDDDVEVEDKDELELKKRRYTNGEASSGDNIINNSSVSIQVDQSI